MPTSRWNAPINATEVKDKPVAKKKKSEVEVKSRKSGGRMRPRWKKPINATESKKMPKRKLTIKTDISDHDSLHPKFDSGTDFAKGKERAHHHKMMMEHHGRLEAAYSKLSAKHGALFEKHNNAYGKNSS